MNKRDLVAIKKGRSVGPTIIRSKDEQIMDTIRAVHHRYRLLRGLRD